MKKKYIIILIMILILLSSSIIYLNTYYKATNDVTKYLKSSKIIDIKKDENGYLFDGPGDKEIFVFYPGAKVEYTAYAPLLRKLSEEGIDTFLVKMPFNIAFFKINRVDEIMKKYKYNNWYIGGHSLGGLVASMNTKNQNIKGLILLASYSINKVECKVLSIYGTKDGVLNHKSYKKNIKNIPNRKEIILKGGNHSYFGNYGKQKGDKQSTISRKKQQEKTIEAILKFITE